MSEEKPRLVVLAEALIYQLSLAITGADHEGTDEIIGVVRELGFATLDEDVRAELLQLAKYFGWTDGEKFFLSLKKTEAV